MRSGKKSKVFWKRKGTHNSTKSMGHSEDSIEREIYSNTGLPKKKDRNISNKQPNPTSTRTRKKQETKLRASKRKEIIQIHEELNDIETKKNNSNDQ